MPAQAGKLSNGQAFKSGKYERTETGAVAGRATTPVGAALRRAEDCPPYYSPPFRRVEDSRWTAGHDRN